MTKGSTCSCFHPMWKLAFHTMEAKMSWIASWVLMHSLPWVQCKRWILIRSMGCVHTHWGRLVIDGCGSLNLVWSNVENIGEDSLKVRKIGWAINQAPTLRPEYNKIQAWWALGIVLESMLKRVWWCKCFKMESWSQTIWCLMSCSKIGRHVHGRGGRR
jgi:hypothetical protein